MTGKEAMNDTGQWVYWFSDPPPPAGEADRDLKRLLGGKGASLKEMTRAGMNVPPGFTISVPCCRRYFERERVWPEGLEEEVHQNLRRLEDELGRRYANGAQPLLVSVRSGAAVSMPGMMDTILNCGLHPGLGDEMGDTPKFWRGCLEWIYSFSRTLAGLTPDSLRKSAHISLGSYAKRESAERLLEAYQTLTGERFPTDPWELLVVCINAVFDSWHCERAVTYRKRQGISDLDGTAVNIQAMFPSEVSGVLFTRDPMSPEDDHMVVEAARGLGDAVVSGEVTPDRFLVRRGELTTVESSDDERQQVEAVGRARLLPSRASKPGDRLSGSLALPVPGHPQSPDRGSSAALLDRRQLAELGELGLRVEEHFGHPVDVEWAWADGQFALLQARAIRGLDVAGEAEAARREEITRLRGLANGSRRVWVVHNLAETLRLPTPLTWDVVRQFMSGDGGFGRLYRSLGYRPSRATRRDGFLELIAGRVYADPDRLAEMFWDGMPTAYDLDALRADPSLINRGPTRFDPDKASGRFLWTLPATLWAMCRSASRLRWAERHADRRFQERVLPPYLDYVQRKQEQVLSSLSDQQLFSELEHRRRRVLDEFGAESLLPGFVGSLALEALRAQLVQLMGTEEGTKLAITLTSALHDDTTLEQNAELHDAAAGRTTLEEFLGHFGHRAHDEMELAQPRWREEPSHVEQMIARIANRQGPSPREMQQRNVEQQRAAYADLPNRLADCGGSSLRENVERELEVARRLLPYRESGKHYLMMGYELIRVLVLEIGRLFDLGEDVFFLKVEELERFRRDADSLRERIAIRKQRHEAWRKMEMPPIIDSDDLENLGLPRAVESVSELCGAAIAPGVARGVAKIVCHPDEAADLPEDCILVCPCTDPGWTPLFPHVNGLVLERGGILSHGAIVARDFGIPAVVCAEVTRLIASGDSLRVDGNSGRVEILEKAG